MTQEKGSAVSHTRSVSPKIGLALLATLAVGLCLLLSTDSAKAAWSPYCNNITLYGSTEPGQKECGGAPRSLHAVWGLGDQKSVCVWTNLIPAACSAGPGWGVYAANPAGIQWYYSWPNIRVNAPGGASVVHGSAEVP